MAVVEIVTFRLGPGVDEDAFVAADRRVQTEFMYQRPGLLRRTTARGDGGDWLVVAVWDSGEHAAATQEAARGDAVVAAFSGFVDAPTVRIGRYRTLE